MLTMNPCKSRSLCLAAHPSQTASSPKSWEEFIAQLFLPRQGFAWREMADEALLASQRVVPAKLSKDRNMFHDPDLRHWRVLSL
jgi:hypothetical protein